MNECSLAAARELSEEGVDVEVIDMRWLRPLNLDTERTSLDKSGLLLVVEEQVHAELGRDADLALDDRGARVGAAAPGAEPFRRMLIPYSPPLEDESIPGAEAIAARVRGLLS